MQSVYPTMGNAIAHHTIWNATPGVVLPLPTILLLRVVIVKPETNTLLVHPIPQSASATEKRQVVYGSVRALPCTKGVTTETDAMGIVRMMRSLPKIAKLMMGHLQTTATVASLRSKPSLSAVISQEVPTSQKKWVYS
jgi:hypothetical protein